MLHKSNGNVMSSEETETIVSKPSLNSDKKTGNNNDENRLTDDSRQDVEAADHSEDSQLQLKKKKKKNSILDSSNTESTSSSGNNESSEEDERLTKSSKRNQSDDAPGVTSSESDVEEEDVKVCDICGDAGREDLLAVCSKCSDGAEHTYCMRDMLDEVPEGDWLCEECKSNELLEARKLNHLKKLESQESSKSPRQTNSLKSDFPLKLDSKDTFERPKLQNLSLRKQASFKRPRDRTESYPAAKHQALESNVDSPTSSSPSKTAVLSKDTLSKSSDKIKGKPSNQISRGAKQTGYSYENGHTATTSFPVRKGNFLKSKSFSLSNSKQNVKVSENFLQKQDVDSKEGIGKLMGKSTSFKGLGRSSSIEPKVKMLHANSAPAQDVKGQKHGRDRTPYERKSLIKLDHSLSGQMTANLTKRPSIGSDGISTSFGTNIRDHKNVQIDGKSSMSKHAAHLIQKSSDIMPNSGDVKKPSSTGIGGSTSVNGAANALENQVNNVKDGSMLSPARHADKLLHADGARAEGLDSQSEKPQCSKQGFNNRMVSGNCRKLPSDANASKIKDGLLEENKLKAAIEAAMQKKQDIFKKIKIPEKSTEFSKGNFGRDAVSNEVRDTMSEEPMHEGDMDLHDNSLNSSKQIPVSGAKQIDLYPVSEPVLTPSAIPEQESIWQGGFEIHRNGKVPDMCGGFQAHMSICASGKVLEMVGSFPKKIIFNEVPRPCAWPGQFREHGPQEDNIALYFFAKDSESYMRSYKILVDYMMKHDLALRGNINGVELLVFPSNHLPRKSKCWNTLYFIWGIFRGKRPRVVDDRFRSLGKCEIPDSERAVVDKDVAASENPCLYKPATEKLSVSGNNHTSLSRRDSETGPVVVGSSLQHCASVTNGNCYKEEHSSGGPCLDSPITAEKNKRPKHRHSRLGEACSESGSAALREECQRNPDKSVDNQEPTGKIDRDKSLPLEVTLDKQDSPRPPNLPFVSKQDVTVGENVNKVKSENSLNQENQSLATKQDSEQIKIENDDKKGDLNCLLTNGIKLKSDSDMNVSQFSPRRHFLEDSLKPVSLPASPITSKKRPWVDTINISEDNDEVCNIYRQPSFRDRLEVSSSSHKEDDKPDNKNSTPIPLEVAFLRKEDRLSLESPNLELALGVKTKQPGEGVSRLFPPDEDANASLSLSLGFPFTNEERIARPEKNISKTIEQGNSERQEINTSLRLFRGSSGK